MNLNILLDFQERAACLSGLPEWSLLPGQDALHRIFRFPDFDTAFEFMTHCARFAKELDHHPEWTNKWNVVDVTLTTHSAGGLTRLDVRFAEKMDQLFAKIF